MMKGGKELFRVKGLYAVVQYHRFSAPVKSVTLDIFGKDGWAVPKKMLKNWNGPNFILIYNLGAKEFEKNYVYFDSQLAIKRVKYLAKKANKAADKALFDL